MQKLLFIFWVSISLSIALFLFLLRPVTDEPQYKFVEIASGTGFRDIAKILYDQGRIRSPKTFVLYSTLSGSAHQLKPGNYYLSSGSSTPEILRVIVRGPTKDVAVTIPEGATLKDIDVILSRAGILPSGAIIKFPFKEIASEYDFLEFQKSLEGFLFPDTYRFFLNSEVEEVIKKFLKNFENKARSLLFRNKLPITNYQLLITASLLEKEAPKYEDRQIIAGILYKRLKLGTPLQVDATLTYAKCGGAFLSCDDPRVYRKDLAFVSTYNTYLYNGMPPGPIGNPGLDAIKAALNPIASEYLYYLSDPKTKKTIFSQTLDEHNENRVRYLGGGVNTGG